jgi:hypothetical protein
MKPSFHMSLFMVLFLLFLYLSEYNHVSQSKNYRFKVRNRGTGFKAPLQPLVFSD